MSELDKLDEEGSQCEICGEPKAWLTTCQDCGQEFCSACGYTEDEICEECEEKRDEIQEKRIKFADVLGGKQRADLGETCKDYDSPYWNAILKSCAICNHLESNTIEKQCCIPENERKRKFKEAQVQGQQKLVASLCVGNIKEEENKRQ